MDITITIPVKPHLKRYVQKTHKVDPFVIDLRRDAISYFIHNCLEKPTSEKTTPDLDKDYYTDRLEIQLPNKYCKQSLYVLSLHHVIRINNFLQKQLYENIYTTLDLQLKENPKAVINHMIVNIMNYYEITESDISFEAIKRAYYRYRNGRCD